MKKRIFLRTVLILALLALSLKVNTAEAYNYANPLDSKSVTEWIEGVLAGIQGIVGAIAIAMIIIAGILYMFSGTNSNMITTAKNMVMWAMVGFTLAIGAPALLKQIIDIPGSALNPNLISGARTLPDVLTGILNFLLTITGVLALISFVVGGFMYLSSGGDKNRAESAKKITLYSMIAVLVSGSGVIIIREILKILENN